MTNTTQSTLNALSEKATQGEWSIDPHQPDNIPSVFVNGCLRDSWCCDPVCSEDDAAFIVALVNSYRTGHLTVADPAAIAAAEARGFERGIREAAEACFSAYSSDGHAAGDWPTPEECRETILAKLESGQ